jgi:hypothetical protein
MRSSQIISEHSKAVTAAFAATKIRGFSTQVSQYLLYLIILTSSDIASDVVRAAVVF